MPVECPIRFPKLEREAFQKLDYRVMQLAFETHKSLGRSCDESIYHMLLAARLEDCGYGPSLVELAINVRHGSFFKEYKVDLVVAEQSIYELKAARSISLAHEAQTMNYLLLAGCEHGKIINFGSTSVESRFVNNPLTNDERYRYRVVSSGWKGPEGLRQALVSFVDDIGLFLEATLYNQVLVHSYGGPEVAEELRTMSLDGRLLGRQKFQMCTPDEAFRVTTLTKHPRAQRASLQKLFDLSDLKFFHWINIHRHEIQFTTISR